MPLVNNKVGDDSTVGKDKALADGKALVDSLIKVSRSSFYLCYDHNQDVNMLYHNLVLHFFMMPEGTYHNPLY